MFKVNEGKQNNQLANIGHARGNIDKLSAYVLSNSGPLNFMISGGLDAEDRYRPLYHIIGNCIWNYPVIILHSNDRYIEGMTYDLWNEQIAGTQGETPMWVVNERYRNFEPFYGMPPMQVVSTFRQLAAALDYTVTHKFERVVKAHIRICEELDMAISLSAFYYLSQFEDLGEFHDNIMQLPCGEAAAKRIWVDLDPDDELYLFRAVVDNLANDAIHSGWNPDNEVSEINCLTALENNAILTLSIDDMFTNMLYVYLTQELKACSTKQFVLILDGVKIKDETFLEYLNLQNNNCCLGFVSENVVEQLGGDEDLFLRMSEKIKSFILFKHGTGKTAAILSELFGRYDYMRAEYSEGTSKGFFNFLPQDSRKDVRYSTENRFRVMPEDIIALGQGQAIVFDTTTDEIIYFN